MAAASRGRAFRVDWGYPVIDLNDLRVFERVATMRSFTAASDVLDLPKSTVSRSIARLEAALASRLLQRTTREVMLTEAGVMLLQRCSDLMGQVRQTIEDVGSLAEGPRGSLRISAGFGFGLNVLAELLPRFSALYPHVVVALDLSSQSRDLVADGVDVAIRMGPLPDTSIVARRLGQIPRYLCASPDYVARRGAPLRPEELRLHDLVDLPVTDGRQLQWTLSNGKELVKHRQIAQTTVNCALTIHRMLVNGAGVGLASAYLCAPDLRAGRLVRLLPDWSVPPVTVHIIYPSRQQLSPAVRAFVDLLVESSTGKPIWQRDLDSY